MKKTNLSLIAAALLTAQNIYADSTTIEEAFKKGKTSGDITLYGEQVNNSGTTNDSGFSMGSIGLNYETDSINGVKAAFGFRSNHDFSEKEEGDFSDGTEPKAVLGVANISYENDILGLTIGRQEIDLEWIGDFHEAAVAFIKPVDGTTVILGHTKRTTAVDPDAALADFERVNDNHGATLGHLIYEGIEGLSLEGYYYKAKELANWYGAKVNYDTDMFGLTVHHAKSSEKAAGADDGDISHLELRTNISDLALNAGYITTDKTGAIGSMDSLGDNINPFEEGNQIYSTDAKTYYIGAGYEIAGISLGAIYGKTDYESNKEEKELNLNLEYGFSDNMSGALVFADIEANDSDDDYNKVALTLSYSF